MQARLRLRLLTAWVDTHWRAIAIALVLIAIELRILLVMFSPTPYGYVWDLYSEGIQVLHREGRLPVAADCWQCAHPPLFYLLGWPFYAFGLWVSGGVEETALRWTGGLSLLASAVAIYYGYRLLRLLRCRGGSLLAGLALLLVFPCLFISSYGAEADIVLTGVLSAFVYYLARYAAGPRRASTADAIRLGALAGLAAATKYSGLAGALTLAIVWTALITTQTSRRRMIPHAVAAGVVCALIGGWKYVDNWQRHGTPFHANGTAAQGFSPAERHSWGRPYEFTTLRLGDLKQAIGPRPMRGELTTLPVYDSVLTTLHALAWSDMSFFSIPSRHGLHTDPYPRKAIPPALTMSVIVMGLLPTVLALGGLARSLRHRRFWPLAAFGVVTLSAYIWWVLPQPSWALKTKYVLFLLPIYVSYVVFGLGWMAKRAPAVALVVTALLVLLLALTQVYLYAFAVGRL